MRTKIMLAIASVITAAITCESRAAIMYATPGSTYSQNFDSLPNAPENSSLGSSPVGWTDDNAAPGAGNFSIVGWYLFHPITQSEGGFSGNQRMRIGAGTATTGAFMSWGSSGSSERSLGMLSSNTMSAADAKSYFGAHFTNNTGATLTEFTLAYTGEQWRDGGASPNGSVAQSDTFDYSLDATSIADGAATFTNVTSLDFTSPIFGATSGTALNGNLAANRNTIGPVTVTGLSWLPGTDLWVRWADTNDSGNDHGLGIDDLSFSADASVVPEPASLTFLGVAVAGLFLRRIPSR